MAGTGVCQRGETRRSDARARQATVAREGVHHARRRGHARQPTQVIGGDDGDPQAPPAAPGNTCRISQANTSPPWRAPVATSGIASTKDATITHPSNARQDHRPQHPARDVVGGAHRLLGGVGRGVEPGHGVDRPHQRQQRHHRYAARGRPDAAARRPAVVGERDQPAEVQPRRAVHHRDGQHQRHHQDQPAAEVGQQRRQPDAEVIEQRVRQGIAATPATWCPRPSPAASMPSSGPTKPTNSW